jgi:hypothetical protein
MSENFENELRRALRPLDAPAGFTERLMASLPEKRGIALAAPPAARPRRFAQRFGIPLAFAAALVVSMLLGQHVAEVQRQRSEQQAGLAASRELMEALKVTSQKLDLAYQAAKAPPPPVEEENRT